MLFVAVDEKWVAVDESSHRSSRDPVIRVSVSSDK